MLLPPTCTVRGHRHRTELHATKTQDGSGEQAYIWACPGGRYRWFQLAAHYEQRRPLSDLTRQTVPRFGWPTR